MRVSYFLSSNSHFLDAISDFNAKLAFTTNGASKFLNDFPEVTTLKELNLNNVVIRQTKL
jgi:hypothetical protein